MGGRRSASNPPVAAGRMPALRPQDVDDGLTGRNRAKLATDILRHLASVQQIENFPEIF
jgi:hypothetical protein